MFGEQIPRLFTNIDEVLKAAFIYMPWMIVSPILSAPSYLLDGLFIGATQTAAMRSTMAISLLIFPASCYLLVPLLGNHGLWLSFMTLMVAHAVTPGVAYPALKHSIGELGEPAVR